MNHFDPNFGHTFFGVFYKLIDHFTLSLTPMLKRQVIQISLKENSCLVKGKKWKVFKCFKPKKKKKKKHLAAETILSESFKFK